LGIHETHFDSKLKDSVQTTSNPFDNESTFLSTDSRATQRKKGKKRKSRFSHKFKVDPEIQREIDRHGLDNVHIIQD
jgi:CTP synthase (UTP-ammonia lyase)